MPSPPPCSSIVDQLDARHVTTLDIEAFHRDGYVVLRGFVVADLAARLRDEVLGIMSAIGLADGTALKQTREYLAGSLIERWIHGDALRAIAARLLGGPSSVYLPFTAVKGPGGGTFSFHQDNQYTELDGPGCNLWLALTPMGEREGTLRMLPRSHLAGTHRSTMAMTDGHPHRAVDFAVDRFVMLDLEPGDLVAFGRLTVHGSGPNQTDAPRVAYAVQYHRNDVRAFFDERWELLTTRPRYTFPPVERLTRPTGKLEGH